MKEIYKDYQIEYSQDREVFIAKIGQSDYENRSLSAVKKYIDNLERKDFDRVDVIIYTWNVYEFGTVTSCVKSVHYGGAKGIDCWVSIKGGSRKKTDINDIYLDNEKNRAIINEITEKKSAIENIEIEIRNLRSIFERYTQKESK